MTFIGFFESNLKFGFELCFRAGALGGTVISGGTRPASRQLICNRFGTGMARQLVGHPKATQSKRTRTADQITH